MVVKTQPGLVSEYNKLAASEEASLQIGRCALNILNSLVQPVFTMLWLSCAYAIERY